jgi:hypothetical protein
MTGDWKILIGYVGFLEENLYLRKESEDWYLDGMSHT